MTGLPTEQVRSGRANAVAVLEVVSAGLLSSVQDAGRAGLESLGVPSGGAADPLGLAVANLIVRNDPGSAAVECTILGPELRVLQEVTVGLGGADLGARALPSGRILRPGASHRLRAGEVLAFAEAEPEIGCRAYLAIAGGIDVPQVLGSSSTSLVGGFGGHEGRPLHTGDRLRARGTNPGIPSAAEAEWPADLPLPPVGGPIRVLAGPDAIDGADDGTNGAAASLTRLLAGDWAVSHASDRRGLRLDGPALADPRSSRPGRLADRPSHGVLPGAIQLTPSGQPIVLMPDAGPTGGYPVIGVVCSADLWLLGQLRPGSEVAFELVDRPTARRAMEERRRVLASAAGRADPHLS